MAAEFVDDFDDEHGGEFVDDFGDGPTTEFVDDFGDDGASLGGVGVGMGAGLAGGLAGAGVGALAGGPVGAALGFLIGDIGAGWLGREAAAAYDDKPSIFDEEGDEGGGFLHDISRNTSSTDLLLDAAMPYALRAAGRMARAGWSTARMLFSSGQPATEAAGQGIVRTMSPFVDEGQALQSQLRESLVAAADDPPVDLPTPRRDATGGREMMRESANIYRRLIKPMIQQPETTLRAMDDPNARLAANIIQLRNMARRRLPSVGQRAVRDALKRTVGKDKKAAKLLVERGHAQMGGAEALADELVDFKAQHQAIADEIATLNEMVGAQQLSPDGNLVSFKRQGDYVFSALEKDKDEVISRLLADPDAGRREKRLAQWLMSKGTSEENAARTAAILSRRNTPQGAYAFSRVYDEAGKPVLPESFYVQDYGKLTASMFERDAVQWSNILVFGSGETLPINGIRVPKLAHDLIAHFKSKGNIEAEEVLTRTFGEWYTPQSTTTRRALSMIRGWGQNAMLTKNAVLQLTEAGKPAAYGYNGLQSTRIGADLMTEYNKRYSIPLSYASGARESNLDQLLDAAEVRRMSGQRLQAIHPVNMARGADSLVRSVSGMTALGSIHLVAKEAAETKGKWSGALLKYAHEIMPRAQSAEEAAAELASRWEAAAAANAGKKGPTLLDERTILDGVQHLVDRWHYTTDPGDVAPVMRTDVGSVALQFRSFMMQAAPQVKRDVIRPIYDGFRRGDMSLAHLGLSRLNRLTGYTLPLTTGAMIVRSAMAGKEIEEDDFAWKVVEEMATTAGGYGFVIPNAIGQAMMGNTKPSERLAQLAPAGQYLASNFGDAFGAFHGKPWKSVQAGSALAGGFFPRTRMLTEGVVGALARREAEQARERGE